MCFKMFITSYVSKMFILVSLHNLYLQLLVFFFIAAILLFCIYAWFLILILMDSLTILISSSWCIKSENGWTEKMYTINSIDTLRNRSSRSSALMAEWYKLSELVLKHPSIIYWCFLYERCAWKALLSSVSSYLCSIQFFIDSSCT